MTRTETRYGCFLSDLTGLARSPSTANLPMASYQTYRGGGQGGDLPLSVIASEAKQSRAVSPTPIGEALDCFVAALLAMTFSW